MVKHTTKNQNFKELKIIKNFYICFKYLLIKLIFTRIGFSVVFKLICLNIVKSKYSLNFDQIEITIP